MGRLSHGTCLGGGSVVRPQQATETLNANDVSSIACIPRLDDPASCCLRTLTCSLRYLMAFQSSLSMQ